MTEQQHILTQERMDILKRTVEFVNEIKSNKANLTGRVYNSVIKEFIKARDAMWSEAADRPNSYATLFLLREMDNFYKTIHELRDYIDLEPPRV